MDLRNYEEIKFQLAKILRAASFAVPKDENNMQYAARELFSRLADDRFNLAVVGRFSRGKTSLINALLGSDRLPTGITPVTSIITAISYGSEEKVILKYNDRMIDQTIEIGALSQYISHEGNPENIQGIRSAEIQLPLEILRYGFYFIDTPGLGSIIEENTRTTEAFLPEADAFVLVTSYESPLSEEEMRIIKIAIASGRRIFIVINKHDTITYQDKDAVLAFIQGELKLALDGTAPALFSVSSKEALVAQGSQNYIKLKQSGLPELKNQLIQFLLWDKSSSFLQQMFYRIRALLRELPTSSDIVQLQMELITLEQGLGSPVTRLEASSDPREKYLNSYRLQSCEVCDIIRKKTLSFLCQYQFDLAGNIDQQRLFAAHGGFCSFHTWEYRSLASPYGICSAYHGLLGLLANELEVAGKSLTRENFLNRLRTLRPTREDCTLCEVSDEAERTAVANLATQLQHENKTTLNDFFFPCLPHLLMIISEIDNYEIAKELVLRQSILFRRFSEDMQRYALKFDAARCGTASHEENSVAERSLTSVAARKEVNCLPRAGAPRSQRTPKTSV